MAVHTLFNVGGGEPEGLWVSGVGEGGRVWISGVGEDGGLGIPEGRNRVTN